MAAGLGRTGHMGQTNISPCSLAYSLRQGYPAEHNQGQLDCYNCKHYSQGDAQIVFQAAEEVIAVRRGLAQISAVLLNP